MGEGKRERERERERDRERERETETENGKVRQGGVNEEGAANLYRNMFDFASLMIILSRPDPCRTCLNQYNYSSLDPCSPIIIVKYKTRLSNFSLRFTLERI